MHSPAIFAGFSHSRTADLAAHQKSLKTKPASSDSYITQRGRQIISIVIFRQRQSGSYFDIFSDRRFHQKIRRYPQRFSDILEVDGVWVAFRV